MVPQKTYQQPRHINREPFVSDSNFLKFLPPEMYYFAGIRSNTKVFLEKPEIGLPSYKGRGPRPKKKLFAGQPEPQAVFKIAQAEGTQWTPVILVEGAKGPVMAGVMALRVYLSKNGLPENNGCWLFIRRSQDGQIKYAISNAPEDTSFSDLCEASIMRWPIEQCFEEGKSHLGMGDYEHRSWTAWHRHMTYVFLGLHFLLRPRLDNKKSPALTLPQAQRLVATVLLLASLGIKVVLEIVRYHTKRNFVPYQCHKKRNLKKAEVLFANVSL